jgi:O-antigen/teichoic acid export membrane protein
MTLRSLTLRTLVASMAAVGIGMVNSILLARWMGPTGRGEIAAAMLWPSILVYTSSMGMFSATTFFSTQLDVRVESVLGNSLFFSFAQSIGAVLLGFFTLPWLLSSQSGMVLNVSRLYLLVIPLSLVTINCTSLLQGRMQIGVTNWLRLIVPTGYLVGVIFLKYSGFLTLLNIIILHLLLNIIALGAGVFIMWRLRTIRELGCDVGLAKKMLKYGLKVQVGEVSQTANVRLDQALMAAWLPPAQLGFYVVAVSAAGIPNILSSTVRFIITPAISNTEAARDKHALLIVAFRKYWILSLLIGIAIGAILPFTIPLVFGVNFIAATLPALILLVGAIAVGAKDVLTGGSQGLGNPWLSSRIDLITFCITGVLLFLLLPRFGIIGAALITTSVYLVQLVLIVINLNRSHNITPLSLFRLNLADMREVLRS